MAIFATASCFVLLTALMPKDTILKNRFISFAIIFILVSTILLYIPSWDLYYADMIRYLSAYNRMNYLKLSQAFNEYSWEPLFILTQWIISKISTSSSVFIITMFLISFLLMYKSAKILFLPWQRVYIIFTFMCYPFFYDYIFNGIRQGIAMMLLILAFSYWTKKQNSFKFFISIALSGLFHYTAFIFSFIMLVILNFNLRLRTIILFWIITATLFLTGENATLLEFNFITKITYIDIYTSNEITHTFEKFNNVYHLFFSAFFLILSLLFLKYIRMGDKEKETYRLLIKCYTMFNSVFLMLGFIAYANRIAAFSWQIIPILVAYPILNKKKHSTYLLFLLILVASLIGITTSPFLKYK